MQKMLACLLLLFACFLQAQERLMYHEIKTDSAGKIISWYHPEPGIAYDHVIRLAWKFWDTMRMDYNGIPYYMNHQVWRPVYNDARGLGGDQLQMALSAWQLLYAYTGDQRVKENMRFIADYYLTNGLSSSTCLWPDIPFPYNNLVYSGKYDGDMILGKGFTQPDKAGSFGWELVKLYKMVSREQFPNRTAEYYLNAAVKIANTLAKNTRMGDSLNSPLPFKVHAETGKVQGSYTTNWGATLSLFQELRKMKKGDTALYKQAFQRIFSWMKKYPMRNNRWGPFFEDIPGWSDTQINAITWTQFMMDNQKLFGEAWTEDVRKIFDWVYDMLGNNEWKKYGVTAINEQTAYKVPGNSHTSRQAAAELRYSFWEMNSDRVDRAIRQLNWATYMVDDDGKNKYPRDQNWLTDGYGDYVRHFLRAMAAMPELAPGNQDHILSSTSIIQLAEYGNSSGEFYSYNTGKVDPKKIRVLYMTYDESGTEKIRLTKQPAAVWFGDNLAKNIKDSDGGSGYAWEPGERGGGMLVILRRNDHKVIIVGD